MRLVEGRLANTESLEETARRSVLIESYPFSAVGRTSLLYVAITGEDVREDMNRRVAAELLILHTELAIECYRREHASYPDSLEDLVPKHLPRIPEDPFGHAPLRYRRTSDACLVYSVGPDGRDDGGLSMYRARGSEGAAGGDVVLSDEPPDVGRAYQREEEVRTQLTICRYAIEAYREKRKVYPENLAALVPEYLPAIPQDPFNGGPFVYRKTNAGCVLYCVGPDGHRTIRPWEEPTASSHADARSAPTVSSSGGE